MHSHVHPSINTCTRNINPIYNDLWTHPTSVKAARALIQTTIGAPSDSFKCDQCDHVFVQKVNLNVHKKIHTECASRCIVEFIQAKNRIIARRVTRNMHSKADTMRICANSICIQLQKNENSICV
eukprot:1064305_1